MNNLRASCVLSVPSLLTVICSVESSAYLFRSMLSPVISRSFRNTLKRYGPLTLPCVVPLLTSFYSHTTSLHTTRCILSPRKLIYQLTKYRFKGDFFSFSTGRLCLTLSNAFEKYAKYHVQIILLFVYTTTHTRFVIFTCRYFKLS